MLVAQNKLSEDQLQRAIEAQKEDRRELGKVLVSLGFISERDLAQAQAQRLNLGYVDLDDAGVDRRAAKLVPEKALRKYGALPLYSEDGQLVVAMSDPTNLHALEDLRIMSGRPILPVVVTEEDLQRVLNRVFEAEEQIADVSEVNADGDVGDPGELRLGVESGPDEAPVIRLVNSILQRAVSEEASDIHLEPQPQELVVRLRVDGTLRTLMSVPPNLQNSVTARLKVLANLDIAERRVPQDGRFSVGLRGTKVGMRVATLPTVHGEEMVLRLLDTSSLQVDLAKLGFSSDDLRRYREIEEDLELTPRLASFRT